MKKRHVILRERFFTVLLAMYYAFFVYSHGLYFVKTGSLTTLLFIAFELIICICVLAREHPKEVSFDVKAWLAASIGTYSSLLFISNRFEFQGDYIFLIIQLMGTLISLAGIFSLNLSFGIVAANRGVKTSGIYKFIRHPMYAGYFVSFICFVIQNVPDMHTLVWNVSILIIMCTALIYRIKYEEELLLHSKEYQEFCKTTKFRLIPGIW